MKIPLERNARVRLGIFGLGLGLVETIAVVPTVAVLRPGAFAYPAKFILALPARHVVATAILFDHRVALRIRAVLRVGLYPIRLRTDQVSRLI